MKKIVLTILLLLISVNTVYAKETVKFSKCVDGDTFKIKIDDKVRMVRMIAIDTPESVKNNTPVEYYGKESSEYTCKRLTNAKKIQLEYDDNSDREDKYDRIIAWVFVDGVLLQEELVKKGYAKVAYLYDDYKYTTKLQEAQELASAKEIGIWDSKAKKAYDKSEPIKEEEKQDYSMKEVIILAIIVLLSIFASDKVINKKKKKKKK